MRARRSAWLSAAASCRVAIKSTCIGQLRTAGSNETGSLGDGSTTARSSYGTVNGVTTAITAAVGGRSFALAVRADGKLFSWGDNTGDQLGIPALSATGTSTATEVPGFSAGP